MQCKYRGYTVTDREKKRIFIPDSPPNTSPPIHEGLSVCPLWGSRGGRGRCAGARVIPSDSKEFKVPVQFVIKSIVGISGLEIFPVLLAEDTKIVRGHGVPAEVGHGFEVFGEKWLSEPGL